MAAVIGILRIGLRLQRFLQCFLDFERNYVRNSKLRADPWNSWQAAVQCSQIRLAAMKPLRDEFPRTAIRQHRTRDKPLIGAGKICSRRESRKDGRSPALPWSVMFARKRPSPLLAAQ